MAEDQVASAGYPLAQLNRALRQAAADPAKIARWRAVLDGMAAGTLTIGSRTPVADTPAWVTLEVAHGGFATGRYLAETPLTDTEAARVAKLVPPDAPGTTDRERLNLWYLTDDGLTELRTALSEGTYHVEVPEDAALPTVAWLLDNERHEAALDLVAELRPLMHRLRLAPRRQAVPRPPDSLVRRMPVREVVASLRAVTPPDQLAAMLETVRVWHPLYDRLVELWCETVDGDLPTLADDQVRGGWPCAVWPADWVARRERWLADYRAAAGDHLLSDGHRHPRGNFRRLREALEQCERDSGALTGRDVGRIRRALAATVTRHGAPGTERRAALRSSQAEQAARPTHAALAQVLAGRLDQYPGDGGIPSLDPVLIDGVPPSLVAKAARALEAPVAELVERGVITSGEVLATVLPQLTAGLVSFTDPALGELHTQTYGAFRRRRGLLLLNLEHQVRFEELPWVGALMPFRVERANAASDVLRNATLLALTAFPQTILPNPLVRELGALATAARTPLPLVEEIAADIFTGLFTTKWQTAASLASATLAGTLYARYYDLPDVESWRRPGSEDFDARCKERAKEARTGPTLGYVAASGTVLEQSQILTTHNLAVLVDSLGLTDRLRAMAPDLVDRTFGWLVRRLTQPPPHRHAALIAVKNAAYAWRQAVFSLSFCERDTQDELVTSLAERVRAAGLEARFGPAVAGLRHTVAGGRFSPNGTVDDPRARRFLGWSAGPHWLLDEHH